MWIIPEVKMTDYTHLTIPRGYSQKVELIKGTQKNQAKKK